MIPFSILGWLTQGESLYGHFFDVFFSMHHFRYVGNNLQCESVDLAAVAQLYGTPTYVYSAGSIEDNVRRLTRGLSGLDVQLCYAMKANSNIALLRHFANLGASFDLVSGGDALASARLGPSNRAFSEARPTARVASMCRRTGTSVQSMNR